jgi:uncharacterized protein YdeI (YjbR/CyaY-like superfamily)
MSELEAEGLMHPAGRAAFERRREDRSAVYLYEQDGEPELPAAYQAQLEANPTAAEFFASQPAGYRRLAIRWVLTAKRGDTRERRLRSLIEDSAAGLRISSLRRP